MLKKSKDFYMKQNNCESPLNHAIDALTKNKTDRHRIVKALCRASVWISIAVGAAAFAYTYKLLNEKFNIYDVGRD